MRGTQNSDFAETVFNCLTALKSSVGGSGCTYSIESAL